MQTPSSRQNGEKALLRYLHSIHGVGATIPLETYIEAALYAPEIGYYARPNARVGYREGRDFYTAESLGSVFRRLVADACVHLLPDRPEAYTFTELGAEPGTGLFAKAPHPFARDNAYGCKDPFDLAGPRIVFSNELFDAQAFRRFEFRQDGWVEHAVQLGEDHFALTAIALNPSDEAGLPPGAREGDLLDDPSGARRLIERIATADWHGLFIAFDYGLDRETLHHRRPAGTGRTYRAHRMGEDLLEAPGETDITHHISWDDLEEALQRNRFEAIQLQTQESFFVHHSTTAIAQIVEAATLKGLHRDLQTLKELLHPTHMGRKFQVLSAYRTKNTCQGSTEGR